MIDDCTGLDWQPSLFVKVIRQPFNDMPTGLAVKRLYLAQNPNGILSADWTLPADERFLPIVQLTGWKPERDVPFDLPIQYKRGDRRVSFLIPYGTWVLPYDDEQYHLYERVQTTLQMLLMQVETAPTDPQTLRMLSRWSL